MDAQLFESLRHEYGEDEIQAWIEVSASSSYLIYCYKRGGVHVCK